MRRNDGEAAAHSDPRRATKAPPGHTFAWIAPRPWQWPRQPLILTIASIAILFSVASCAHKPSSVGAHASPSASPASHAAMWQDAGLSAQEQIVFSHSDPHTGYSCGIANKTVELHITHDGGMSWQPQTLASTIASETCALAVNDTDARQLALMTLVTAPDPCLTTACTPTPCSGACQPCIDYCPPPPRQTLTLYRSSDGGRTWDSVAALPGSVHFTQEIAFAGGALYVWTDTWPTLLASSVAGESFRLIDLSAYFPATGQDNNTFQATPSSNHLWPLRGQLFVPIPGGDHANRYILSSDGGASWTRRDFTLNGDPVELRPGSGLDGRTLMGERINGMGYLALSTDGGVTWQSAPAPYPDFSHYGLTQCYASADGAFLWFNGFDASVGLGVYQAKAGAPSWTMLLDATQIQNISVDLVSFDAQGRPVALWGRESRTKWVIYRLK